MVLRARQEEQMRLAIKELKIAMDDILRPLLEPVAKWLEKR